MDMKKKSSVSVLDIPLFNGSISDAFDIIKEAIINDRKQN